MSRELEQLDKSRTSCSSSKGQRNELARQTEQKEGVETQLPALEDNQEVISVVVVVVLFLSAFAEPYLWANRRHGLSIRFFTTTTLLLLVLLTPNTLRRSSKAGRRRCRLG